MAEDAEASEDGSHSPPRSLAPHCFLVALVLSSLCVGGGVWLFRTPTHAANGARILQQEGFGDVVNVRFFHGVLQVVASDGRLWNEGENSALAPLSSLTQPGTFPQSSISGDYVALPRGMELRVLDTLTNQIREIPGEQATAGASGGALIAASSAFAEGVRVFSAESGARLWEDGRARGGGVLCLAFGRDHLAVGGKDSQVLIYQARTGKLVEALRLAHSEVHAVAFSPDGSKLAAADAAGVVVWSVGDWDTILQLPTAGVSRLAFSQDGAWLGVGESLGQLEVWDLGGTRLQSFGHDNSRSRPADSVRGIAFGGSRVAWCVRDQVYVAELDQKATR